MPSGYAVQRDVVFAQRPGFRPLSLDLYLPDAAADPAPLIVFVHGGGWRLGTRGEFLPGMDGESSFGRLVRAGFAVASVDYRLSGEAVFPAQVDDVRDALAWARDGERGFDSSRIVLWGDSAGATLAALVGLEPGSGVAGVIDWFGPSDLPGMAAWAPDAERPTREDLWLGHPVEDDTARATAASPRYQAHTAAPAFLIAHGDADVHVPIAQSVEFAEALAAHHVAVEFEAVPGAGHFWRGAPDLDGLFDRALDFVRRVTAR